MMHEDFVLAMTILVVLVVAWRVVTWAERVSEAAHKRDREKGA